MTAIHKIKEFNDPFTTDRTTRLIHLNEGSVETAALLSRYSRSTKSLIDLVNTEFQDENRAPTFISKLLNEYGDESIAEMANEMIGIEGLSVLAASKLTDSRIGISFIEKSTRYVPFDINSFYIPEGIYEAGLVDEYKDLCGLSHRTFNFLYNELIDIFTKKYPIENCRFHDSTRRGGDTEVLFEGLKADTDIQTARRSYIRAVKDKAFDIAGYAWLSSLKTNIGMNSNARALKNLIENMYSSSITELNDIGHNLNTLLSPSPFLGRLKKEKRKNTFEIYTKRPSITSVYKSSIINLLRPEEKFLNTMKKETDIKRNSELIKNLLSEIGIATTTGNKVKFKGSNVNTISIDVTDFEPWIALTSVYDEKSVIDTLCSTILYENNENLLEYDRKNINNIDDNLRIINTDVNKVKEGILFDMLNHNSSVEDLSKSSNIINNLTENTISFDNLADYWYYNSVESDGPLYQNYHNDKELTLEKDQEFLITKYIGERKTRRDKLGRAFEFLDYSFEISSSFRIMREFKRHRLTSSIYPQVLFARNSYDSFIFPTDIVQNQELFEAYKNLIDKSFALYQKVVDKCDYVTAQYVLPLSTRCNYISKINARELDYILGLRTTPQAHEEFRTLAHGMYTLVKTVHPNISKLFTFTDLQDYNLGRIKQENQREVKLNNLS